MLIRKVVVNLAFAAMSIACSDESVTDAKAPLGLSLSLSPAVDTLFLATAQTTPSQTQLTPSAQVHGTAVPLPGHVFETADANIATVDNAGLVTAQAVGTTTISVRVNDVRAASTIVVLSVVKSVTVTAPVAQALVGDTIQLTAATVDWMGAPVAGEPITFSSSAPFATVTPAGKVVFTAPGTATITATSGTATASVSLTALARQFVGGGSASISSGLDATCGLLPLGRTYCFGKAPLIGVAKDTSCFGRTGEWDAGPAPCTLVPLQIAGKLSLTALAVGDSVACGIATGGAVYCWGAQTYGQIGNGIAAPGTSALPTRVTGPLVQAATFTQIAAGGAHACGLVTTGTAFCWGKDLSFQLGGGDNLNVNSSTPIPVQNGMAFTRLAAGRSFTCGIRTTGATVCWGDNARGQLGRGTSGDTTDVAAAVLAPNFTQISARGDNACGLTATGAIYCWGDNTTGQTGQSSGTITSIPSQVAGGGYTFVSVGGRDSTKADGAVAHACALSGTTVSCWGSNRYGQLGRGNLVSSPTPVAVPGSYSALSAGARSTCAVAADGAYCWGSAIYGAAGNQIQALSVQTPTLVATPQ